MLQQISIYLLKVICISGLLFLYYHVALRNKQFHYYNRFYLLLAVVLSIVLPFVQLQWFTFFTSSPQTIHLYKIVYGKGEEDIVLNTSFSFNWQQIALYFLAAISGCLLLIFSIRIIKIQRLKKKYPVQELPEFDFVNTDISAAPFSFFKSIFWRNDISLNEETGKQILQHEITHIKQKHSWDKIFMQVSLCFYWMNPFFYLIEKELFLIHEFIADENAVKHSDADAFAKMLLTARFGKFQFLPAQSIFYSSIKRRLIMLTTSKKPGFSYVRRIFALPLIATLVCLFAFTVKNKNADTSSQNIKTIKPFVLVVDAGHGGKDYGAVGNGMYEKDVVLKIAEKIKELSSQYGVDVILTRNSDVFMNPIQKSDFANGQNADAFITIHVSAASKNEQADPSGIEIYVSEKNKNLLEQSQVFGSSILQNVSTDFKAATALNTRNVGIWVTDNSKIPSALIECGYITNTDDANNLKDDSKIELMAKNILKGVAIYANNSFDKSNLYRIQPTEKDTNAPSLQLKPGAGKPLYVLDGKIIKEDEFKKVRPENIESMNVLKDKDATDKYGDKGKYGVIEIILKNDKEKRETQEPAPPLPPPSIEASATAPLKPISIKLSIKDTLDIKLVKALLVAPVVKRDTLIIAPAKAPSVN
jgi:N-acetylmuramoyl-L-alanine amidase